MSKPQLGTDYFYRTIQSEKDKSFIYDAWMKGYANSETNPFKFNQKPHFLYWKYQKQLIKDLIGTCNVVMICGEEQSDLYGFIVYEIEHPYLIVHWIYIKKDFRHFGLATELLKMARHNSDPNEKIIATHLSSKFTFNNKMHNKLNPTFVYLPTWSFAFEDE